MLRNEPTLPSKQDSNLAGVGLELLSNEAILKLEGQNESLALPPSVTKLLKRILSEMAQGNAVDVVSLNAELTTQQAADLLNVSRPFVVKLLDANELPHRLVGRHRRVMLKDVMSYKDSMQRKSLNAMDELAELSQTSNTY